MHPIQDLARPATYRAPSAAGPTFGAIALVLIMVGSGFLVLAPTGVAHAAGAAPVGTVVLPPPGLESGPQMQKGGFLTSPTSSATAAMKNATILGVTPPLQSTSFTIGFALQNASELARVISEQSAPGSPMFHQWLSLGQEQKMFAPNPVVVQNTINYYTSMGFTVTSRGLLSVGFSGSAAEANAAFKTNLVQVRFTNGTMATENQQPLSVPAAFASAVLSVNGLNTYSQYQVQHFLNPSLVQALAPGSHANIPAAALADANAAPASSVGPWVNLTDFYNYSNHAFGWAYYYEAIASHYRALTTLSPGALNYLYDALPLINAGYNGNSTGTPINIAIVMAGGINPDDMRTYGQMVWNNPNNILSRLTALPVDGSFGLNGTLFYTDGASNEMALDIEYSSTMAPGAHITAVYGPGLYNNVLDDDYAALESLTTAPNIVSNSYGGGEDLFGSIYGYSWDNYYTVHNYIMLLTARGTSVLASSGDGGGFDSTSGMLAGSSPATDPYVLSVNGIRTTAQNGNGQPWPLPNIGYTNITAPFFPTSNVEFRVSHATGTLPTRFWYTPYENYTLTSLPPAASGGFGISSRFNQSWWQHGPFMPNIGRSLGSGVAAEADFNQSIFFDGVWEFGYGGTSFACPTTAGMFALIESYLTAQGFVAPGQRTTYLGELNQITTWVGNAYYNGNLTLVPYDDVTNGTSYWGNVGVTNGWSWPTGGLFPHNASGATYGDTGVGWDFPTGWGVINVANFARDLSTLMSLPGQFTTVTQTGLSWDPSAWGNLARNNTYTFHVNASAALQGTNPHVTLVFTDSSGLPHAWQPTLTAVSLGPGYEFTINTANAPFDSPGYLYFEFGNSANRTLGWTYDWIAQDISATGQLNVTVVSPGTSSIPGGSTVFNSWLGWIPGVYTYPNVFGLPYPNTFSVLVTDNGRSVYNAEVTATIPTVADIAWQGSTAAQRTAYRGQLGSAIPTPIISQSFSNLTGIALVQTLNVIKPTPVFINVTYGPLTASTRYTIAPMPNVQAVDNNQGNWSSNDMVRFLLNYYHLPTTQQYQNAFVPNSANQTGYYSILYGWQGEMMKLKVNDYTGAPISNAQVWLGNYGAGHVTRFTDYQEQGGAVGITNTSGTANVTDSTGNTELYIPDNMTAPFGFTFNGGPYAGKFAGLDMVSVNIPGQTNRTYSYTESCFPPFVTNYAVPPPPYHCMYNSSFARNYSSTPVVVFPDPINTFTQTQQGAARDFFSNGASIGWHVNVSLPNNDPWIVTFGTNWNPGTEHIVSVQAYVDGQPAGNLTPSAMNVQNWIDAGNLSGNYTPGIHTLLVVVKDSMGHIFTQRHIFIVGSVSYTDFSPSNVYSLMPFDLNWTVNIPAAQFSNKTFNTSLEIRYVASGCGGPIFPCPMVVNLSLPIHPYNVTFSQNINRSLLQKDGFYSGAEDLPPGQYQLIVWLNANHSGSIQEMVPTYLVFDPLTAQIDGPGPSAQVPLGNLTISYSYSAQYLENAQLYVYAKGNPTPVFQAGALVPGIGGRGGSATWTAVQQGPYHIVLNLTTPYTTGNYSVGEWINVTSAGAGVYINTTANTPLFGNAVMTATVLTLVGALVGLVLGLYLAGSLRPGRTNGRSVPSGVRGSAKPWESAGGATAAAPATGPAGENVCSICHEKFETAFALTQHAKISHGIEE